jgi:DNA-binding transcriptional MocR family regulator
MLSLATVSSEDDVMTPAEEARFIELWQQGASYRELAAALGCPLGTVSSRASALVAQGKIQARPRGGAYPKQQARARQEGAPLPVQTPVQQPVRFRSTPFLCRLRATKTLLRSASSLQIICRRKLVRSKRFAV